MGLSLRLTHQTDCASGVLRTTGMKSRKLLFAFFKEPGVVCGFRAEGRNITIRGSAQESSPHLCSERLRWEAQGGFVFCLHYIY